MRKVHSMAALCGAGLRRELQARSRPDQAEIAANLEEPAELGGVGFTQNRTAFDRALEAVSAANDSIEKMGSTGGHKAFNRAPTEGPQSRSRSQSWCVSRKAAPCGAVDEQAAQITVSSFAYSAQARFAHARALSWHQAEPGDKFFAACNRCRDRRGDNRADPWDGS
jgi:hypothetical protein